MYYFTSACTSGIMSAQVRQFSLFTSLLDDNNIVKLLFDNCFEVQFNEITINLLNIVIIHTSVY